MSFFLGSSHTRYRVFLCVLCPAELGFWRGQVVFVSTEVSPWSKVGGLGDVMAALPVALAARRALSSPHPPYYRQCAAQTLSLAIGRSYISASIMNKHSCHCKLA